MPPTPLQLAIPSPEHCSSAQSPYEFASTWHPCQWLMRAGRLYRLGRSILGRSFIACLNAAAALSDLPTSPEDAPQPPPPHLRSEPPELQSQPAQATPAVSWRQGPYHRVRHLRSSTACTARSTNFATAVRTVRLNSSLISGGVSGRTATGCCVGMLPPGQPQIGNLIPAGCLQLAAGAHAGHEAVQPHAQQRAWMVGRRSQHFSIRLHSQLYPSSLDRASTNSATNRRGDEGQAHRVSAVTAKCSRFISRGIAILPVPTDIECGLMRLSQGCASLLLFSTGDRRIAY